MKLKVLVLKKQQLIWILSVVAALIIIALIIIGIKSKDTLGSNIIGLQNTYTADIDNDSRDDTIVINTDEETSQYSINVTLGNGKTYSLEPDPSIGTLGYMKDWWRMNVAVKDVDGVKGDEIIVQSSDDNGPILNVFRFNKGNIERLTSGRYSMIGTLKNPNDNSNIIVLGNNKGLNMDYTYLTTENGKLRPYFTKIPLNIGKESLDTVINCIEKNEVAASSMNVQSKYTSRIEKGKYLDCSLYSAKYTSHEYPTECIYIVRGAVNEGDNTNKPIVYKVKMLLKDSGNAYPMYDISDITVLESGK